MNSTWMLDGPNSTQNIINNGSIARGIIPDEETGESEDAWYQFQIQGKTYMTCILIIASLGVAGNITSFIIMMDRKVSSFAFSIYMKWLAVSDSVLLIMVSTEDTLDTYDHLHYLLDYDVNLCKAWNFIKSVTFILSPWLIVALTLDRFVRVVFPHSRHVLCTRSKAMILCATLTLVTLALNIYPTIFLKMDDDDKCEGIQTPSAIKYIIFLNLVLKSTAPCVLVLVLNVITISQIRKSRSYHQHFTEDNISKTVKERKDKITLPLLVVSVFAFITLLPRTVTEVVEFFLEMSRTDYVALRLANNTWPIFNVIYLLNFALNFYLLMVSWPEYRMLIKNKFVRCKANDETNSRQAICLQSLKTSSTEDSETCVFNMAEDVS